MKKILLFFLIFTNNLKAQNGYDNLWMFGYDCCSPGWGGTNIDFKTGIPNIYAINRYVGISENFAAISDSVGNLLCYTNGLNIYNKIDSVMQGGDSLSPTGCMAVLYTYNYGSYNYQGSIILQYPNNPNLFYFVHNGCETTLWPWPYPKNLFMSVIDISQNNGLGTVITKNNIIATGNMEPPISAVKHANGRDWWVVTHSCEGDTFFTFLVDPQGFHGPYIQKFGQVNSVPWQAGYGQSAFSRDGLRYLNTTNCDINVYDFDRCSGLFSNWQPVFKNGCGFYQNGCCSFSASGRFVYYMDSGYYVTQYDLDKTNWQQNYDTVATSVGFVPQIGMTYFSFNYLAPDDKIYILQPSINNTINTIHVINKPDTAGIWCDVQQNSVIIPTYNDGTVPNYPNYRLGKLQGSPCDTLSFLTPALSKGEGVMQCFPNPATNEVNIKIKNVPLGNYTLSIYSPLANEVMHIESKNTAKDFTKTLRVQSLASGFYFVKLQVEGMEWYGRFVRE